MTLPSKKRERSRCYISVLYWPQPTDGREGWQVWSFGSQGMATARSFNEAVPVLERAVEYLRKEQPDRQRYMLWTRDKEVARMQQIAQVLWVGGVAGPGLLAHRVGWVPANNLLELYICHMGMMAS